jgi:hypothetical protein
MPTEVCGLRQGSLRVLVTDCEVVCDCCTDCEVQAPTSRPTTVAEWRPPTLVPTSAPVMPTPPPTNEPTIAPPPTDPPTLNPTDPPEEKATDMPTRTPVTKPPTTDRPTVSATVEETEEETEEETVEDTDCSTWVDTRRSCYAQGEQISASFNNCDPQPEDWIGIYYADANPDDVSQALLWIWSCGGQNCGRAVESASVAFSGQHLGGRNSVWPMNPGNYRMHFLKVNDRGSYQASASSDVFEVDTSCN